jgi:hypothetical protein
MTQQNTVNSRLVYENAKKNLQDAGVSLAAAKLTQSFLRLENQLVVGKTQFAFPVLNNQPNFSGTIFPTEQRLNLQDSFVAAMWGIFLSSPAANTAVGRATAILHTYPNATAFPTAGTAAAAETIYNSYFQLSVNNDIILPAWDASRHRLVPQTQNGVGVTAQTIFPEDEIDLGSDGFYPVEPNLVFIGSKNSVLTLIMPAALAAVESFETISIIFRGVLAQNSTIIT